MGKLADKIAYLKETCEILRERLSALTGHSYGGWSLRSVVTDIVNINAFQFITYSNGTYEDHFGTITVGNALNYTSSFFVEDTLCFSKQAIANGNVKLKNLPCNTSRYIDLSYGGVKSLTSETLYNIVDPYCLIFPEQCIGFGGCPYIFITSSLSLKRGIYLPKTCEETRSLWIKNSYSASKEVVVKCPVDTSFSPIYLSAISMTATTMVDIFNNLKDVSSETATYKIQVGNTNLAKLTTEQKNIAINKGWTLS